MATVTAPGLDQIFSALADPTRRAILRRLLDRAQPVGDLAQPFAMSLAGVSKHVQVLGRAGLVSQVQSGRERTCRLEPDGLNAAFVWMQGFGAFDGADLDVLERLLTEIMGEAEADG